MDHRGRIGSDRARLSRAALGGVSALALAVLAPQGVRAQEASFQQEVSDLAASTDQGGISPRSIANSLPSVGDPSGVRRALARRGFTTDMIYTGEVLSNASGGIRRGTAYGGKLEMNFAIDLQKAAGLEGLSFYTNGFQIHQSKGISRNFVGNFNTISAIEALPSTRLSELWFEQKLGPGGWLGIRVGQLAADSEFFISTYSLPFVNSDWPAILANNLPGGGPAYPLSTPGVRVKADMSPNVTLLGAVFNGDPAGRNGDPEVLNRTGTNFRTRDPGLLMGEMQIRYNQEPTDRDLAGILRFGAYQHLGKFDSQRLDVAGGSLAAPGAQAAARLKGNGGLYAIVDQQLYRPEGGDTDSGIATFARVSAAPSARSLIGFYFDAGLTATGFVPDRPKDIIGATFLYSQLSRDAAALDREIASLAGLYRPISHSELSVELSYVAVVRTGWTIQPNVHYIFRPNGGRVQIDPAGAVTAPIKDATVFGLRTTIVY